MKTPAKN